MSIMKLSEVAAFLGKSIDMIRQYRRDGYLTAEKRGKELFFDRDEVVKFAESRCIRTLEGSLNRSTKSRGGSMNIKDEIERRFISLEADRTIIQIRMEKEQGEQLWVDAGRLSQIGFEIGWLKELVKRIEEAV